MNIRQWGIWAIALTLIFAAAMAQAMPKPAYFCQDDFTMLFAEMGNPFSTGTTISGDGRLLNFDQNTIAGRFFFEGTLTQAEHLSNGTWSLDFGSGTLEIKKATGSTILWAGTIDHFILNGAEDLGTRYNASNYLRPSFENEPTEFISVGNAQFTRTSGTWTDPALKMDWIGSYNWNFDAEMLEDTTSIFGNLQAKLSIVPEPAGIIAVFCGITGLIGFGSSKRRRQ